MINRLISLVSELAAASLFMPSLGDRRVPQTGAEGQRGVAVAHAVPWPKKSVRRSITAQKQKRRRSSPFHLRFYGFVHLKNKPVIIVLYSLAGILPMLL